MHVDHSQESHHKRSLERLAREARVPASEVARLYELARAELEAGARIKGFVGILALRNVRKMLVMSAGSLALRGLLGTAGAEHHH